MTFLNDLQETERLLDIVVQQLERKRAPRAVRTDIEHARQLVSVLIKKETDKK